MYNITLQQIEIFLTIAKHLNLSKAADSMFISQSALSKTLRRLEDGISLRLFTRSNQGVTLTREGEYLLSTLDPLYSNINRTIQTAQSLSAAPSRLLRIVAPSSYDAAEDYGELKRLVRQYENAYPDTVLIETLCDFQDLRQALEFGNADIVFAHDFAVSGLNGISFLPVSQFTLYIAMSASHPLARRSELCVEEMENETFYISPRTGGESDKDNVYAQCRALGFTPKSVEFVPNFETLLHVLRKRRGVSICGKFKYAGEGANEGDIAYFPLSKETQHPHVGVAWRTDRLSREARDFINLLR